MSQGIKPPVPTHGVLQSVSWGAFEALVADLGERRGRIAYDQGTLEIMSPSRPHESLKRLIGRLIEAFTEEMSLDILSCSSTTLKSGFQKKGVEPDECYYVQNEAAVSNREELDLSRDPPPDLVVEIDITRTSLDRRSIYAALGVPEVWVHNGKELQVLRLGEDGRYRTSPSSGVFPGLPLDEVSRFLALRKSMKETALVRAFRAWVREWSSKQ
jgi:Uma2 family endonuclease